MKISYFISFMIIVFQSEELTLVLFFSLFHPIITFSLSLSIPDLTRLVRSSPPQKKRSQKYIMAEVPMHSRENYLLWKKYFSYKVAFDAWKILRSDLRQKIGRNSHKLSAPKKTTIIFMKFEIARPKKKSRKSWQWKFWDFENKFNNFTRIFRLTDFYFKGFLLPVLYLFLI